jgi:hypothetical protein
LASSSLLSLPVAGRARAQRARSATVARGARPRGTAGLGAGGSTQDEVNFVTTTKYDDVTIALNSAADLLRLLSPLATEGDATVLGVPGSVGASASGALWCDALTGPNAGDGARHWVFRGIKDAAYDGVPTALREKPLSHVLRWAKAGGRSGLSEDLLIRAEAAILREFFKKADAQGLEIPGEGGRVRQWAAAQNAETAVAELSHFNDQSEWPPKELMPLAAIAQHNGVATRLLDWSRRPLVSAWFAAAGAADGASPSGTMAIWAARYKLSNQHNDGLFRLADLELTAAARSTNRNLHLQSGKMSYRPSKLENGAWTGPVKAPDQLEELHAAAAELAAQQSKDIKTYLRRFTLPWSEAPALLSLLGAHFVHGATVMSGFAGVADAVRLDVITGRKHTT